MVGTAELARIVGIDMASLLSPLQPFDLHTIFVFVVSLICDTEVSSVSTGCQMITFSCINSFKNMSNFQVEFFWQTNFAIQLYLSK